MRKECEGGAYIVRGVLYGIEHVGVVDGARDGHGEVGDAQVHDQTFTHVPLPEGIRSRLPGAVVLHALLEVVRSAVVALALLGFARAPMLEATEVDDQDKADHRRCGKAGDRGDVQGCEHRAGVAEQGYLVEHPLELAVDLLWGIGMGCFVGIPCVIVGVT